MFLAIFTYCLIYEFPTATGETATESVIWFSVLNLMFLSLLTEDVHQVSVMECIIYILFKI